MGKLLKLVAMVLLFWGGTQLAEAEDGRMAIGPQGGVVFSDFSVSNAPFGQSYDNRTGFMAGVFVELGVATLTLRPELNYVEMGYTVVNTAEVTNRYLEIPLLLKFNPFGEALLSPFLLIGPSWSHHMSSNVTLLGGTTAYQVTTDRWNMAGVAGLGIEFNVAENLGLAFQGRYNFGLRDLDRTGVRIRSRSIYAMGGLTLHF
jgi:opacity protein-like surface antigen